MGYVKGLNKKGKTDGLEPLSYLDDNYFQDTDTSI